MSPGMATTHTPSAAPTIPPEWRLRFDQNIRALDSRQPELAQLLSGMVIPSHVEPVAGRDGSPTFRFHDADGRRRWFGQSSMPSVSARAMFADTRYHGGNVALPGVLTGAEPIVLAETLPRRCAVFVLEPDPLLIALAFYLHDYAALIESGRVVLVPSGDMRSELVRFFQRYPGYEMPTFLMRAAPISPAQLAELQRQLEHAGQAVIEHQTGLLSASLEGLRGRKRGPIPEPPRLAVLGLDVHPSVVEDAVRIGSALDRLGWPHVISVPDRPDQCHMVARIQAMIQGAEGDKTPFADAVLFIGRGAGTIRPLLPESLSLATWINDNRPWDWPSVGPIGPHDALFVSDADVWEKLRQTLADDGRETSDALFLCEPAADDVYFYPLESSGEKRYEVDVLLVGDLPDDRPEAAGIELTSHVALWNEARRIAGRWADEDRPLDPQRVLDEASRTTGVSISEPSLRDSLSELIQTRLVPSALAHGLLHVVESTRLRGGCCGAHWRPAEGKTSHQMEAIPSPSALNGLYNASSLVVFSGGGVLDVRRALDAHSAGASVALRCDGERFRRRFPRLSDLAPSIHCFTSLREFRSLLKRTERDSRPVRMEGHTVAARLAWMMECLRHRHAGA